MPQPSGPFPLTNAHLPAALELSRAVLWPYRLEDWAFALDLGRGFGVELGGRLVGTALWWPYGDDAASTGMIIVADDAQRMGIGAALMNALLADTAERTVILNSTEEGYRLYERLGFVADGEVYQHQAILEQVPTAPCDDGTLRTYRAADRDALIEFDRNAAGFPRNDLLDALLGTAETLVVERAGRIEGYGCVRTWGRGVVVGPIAARTNGDAPCLIASLAARHVGEFVRIDVTSASGLSPWLESLGLPRVGHVVAMARGHRPKPCDGARLFALSNQSLG